MVELTEDQKKRYKRHLLLKEVGVSGQQKLLKSRVLIIGMGGLGSPIAFYLAAAGVGLLGLADNDKVDISNLQRQIIHFTRDIDRAKTLSAQEKIQSLNPDVDIKSYGRLSAAKNLGKIVKEYDFVVDATDNFQSKFLINDICVQKNVPFSHGGVSLYSGQTMTVLPGVSACYRCVFGQQPPTGSLLDPSQSGLLGVIAGMLGTIQAAEALKYLTGSGDLLADRLLNFDAQSMNFRKISLKRNMTCSACGK